MLPSRPSTNHGCSQQAARNGAGDLFARKREELELPLTTLLILKSMASLPSKDTAKFRVKHLVETQSVRQARDHVAAAWPKQLKLGARSIVLSYTIKVN
jgi:hypothetical protein